MTDIEQRLHEAADAARRAGATVDRGAMLARIEGQPASPARAWRLALAAAVVAVAAIVGVAVLAPRVSQPIVREPIGDGGTAVPAPTPTSTDGANVEAAPDTRPDRSTGPSPAADCSGAAMSGEIESQPELPTPVATLRTTLAELAVACDYERLADIGGDDLSYSFGASGGAAAYWREGEALTEPGDVGPMGALRLALSTRPGEMEAESAGPSVYWVWPRLHLMTPDSDPAELEEAIDEVVAAGLHTRDELEMMFERHGGYLGWRVIVELPEGADQARWIVFIAGD